MFVENLDVFLREFGKPCVVAGSPDKPFLGIKEQPDAEVRVGGFASTSTMHAVLVKSSVVTELQIKFGTQMTVDGAAYTVREAELQDDGAFTQLNLTKI
jgi:RNase P/RNase MRP subunit p29